METNIFQKGPGAWPGISQTGPLSENSGHVLGPAWPKSPQIMEAMETHIFQKSPGPGQGFPKLAPLVKILGLSWDLPGQSHLR